MPAIYAVGVHDDDAAPERMIELTDERGRPYGTIVIDSTVLGPAFGGIRFAAYDGFAAAQADARRLARAMRDKCALAGLAAGGAKTVVRDDGRDAAEWPDLFGALGRVIEGLGSTYVCGPDVGTSGERLEWVRSETRYVNPPGNDATAATASGVLAAMRAVWPALGIAPRDAKVVVQGLGGVGGRVARALVELGAQVHGADLDPEACARAAADGVAIVPVAALPSIACDVFSPCALGHAIDVAAAERWPTRAICGAANNMLVPGADAVLHRRGVVVVPDVIASAGAVIEGVLVVREGDGPATRARVAETILAIERTAAAVIAASAAEDRTTSVIARARARARLDSARTPLA